MSSQRQLPHPLQNLADVLAPAHAELRLGPQYYGNFGFRRLLLAETVLAQTEQQGPCGWHLRSAVIGFDTEPCHGIANIEAMHRPVFNTSLLTHINLVQHGRTIVSAAGAFDRDWQSTGAAPQPCVDFGAPLDLPPLENWPEDADKDCRDASQQLAAADEFQTLGGFARHRELRTGGPHDFVSLLEPWVTMPDPRGRWREIDELTTSRSWLQETNGPPALKGWSLRFGATRATRSLPSI